LNNNHIPHDNPRSIPVFNNPPRPFARDVPPHMHPFPPGPPPVPPFHPPPVMNNFYHNPPQHFPPPFFHPPFPPQPFFPPQGFHQPRVPVHNNLPAQTPVIDPIVPRRVSPPVPVIPPAEISITDTKLPSLGTIPFLKSAADWVPWFAAVSQLIASVGLRGHICRIPVPGDLIDPTSRAVLPPHYDFDSTPDEAEVYRVFWANDEIADHIIVGKLAPDIANSLLPKRGGPYDMPI
ncbi:hypothetical protein C0992_011129, partial [Termitomyces sp. T32_za158]